MKKRNIYIIIIGISFILFLIIAFFNVESIENVKSIKFENIISKIFNWVTLLVICIIIMCVIIWQSIKRVSKK